MSRPFRLATAAVTLGLIGLPPHPARAQAQQVSVTLAWAHATIGTSNGAVCLALTDQSAPDQLTSASTPVAGMAQLHEDRAARGQAGERHHAHVTGGRAAAPVRQAGHAGPW